MCICICKVQLILATVFKYRLSADTITFTPNFFPVVGLCANTLVKFLNTFRILIPNIILSIFILFTFFIYTGRSDAYYHIALIRFHFKCRS